MKTVGLPISLKENEKRRALIPNDISELKNPNLIYIEKGYGDVLGFSDKDYLSKGVNVANRDEVLKKDIICDPKIGDAEYLSLLHQQTIFGWVHAVQNRDIADKIISSKLTSYAWEDMYEEGRHIFWRNNEIAGEAAILHAYMSYGLFPYNTKAAILGRGNIAQGAMKILNYMGADVTVYNRKTEKLFREELSKYDVVVNAILWDTSRNDHIIYKEDLKRMKKGSLIIDISCDKNGGIETSMPTSINNPIYIVENVIHYVVDHTPSIFWKTASKSLSHEFSRFIDFLIEDNPNKTLVKAKNFDRGIIFDERIKHFQNR
ncbi:N(5)-(carboxyethyl)ornithine synthase [Proteiniphilum sp.]|uniref:N(5)-(carboxyethyl)ornithine synthase n=1 Tax=Proteiniphilum sp. TaxID=1926877 RepID=UPI0033267B2A